MIESVKTRLKETLRMNAKGYTLIAGVFIAGAILSFLLNISAASQEEMKLYINDFISNVKNYSVDSVKTFRLSMSDNIKTIAVLFTMSLCIIGSYGILLYIFIKGFSYGTVFCVLFNVLEAKTASMFLFIVLLHSFISAPCLIGYSLFCLKTSHTIKEGGKRVGNRMLFSFGYVVLTAAVLCVSALIQAYIEPVLIRISGL